MNGPSPLPYPVPLPQPLSANLSDDVSDVAETEEAFWHLIRGRRSIRRYTGETVPPELLTRILEAATWAPSAHNRQPWRFCVVTTDAVQEQLSARMAARWRADLSRDGVDASVIERRVAISHARITGAAALIVPSVSMEEMDSYPDARRDEAERLMAVQSVALATQNLLLAAHHYGLGACWMCAPLFVPDLVRNALGLSDAWQPQALITVGYPAEMKQKERAPIDTRVVWR